MKRLTFGILCCVVVTSAFAQEMPATSKASEAYRTHRETITKPSFGLAKVEALIKKYKLRDSSDESAKLPAKEFAKLTTAEQFTYHMIFGEAYSQNCDAMPIFVDEEKHIYAYPPSAFQDERGWTEQQLKVIASKRKAFLPLLKQTILQKGAIGCNLKSAIIELNAVELIPAICEVYKRKRYDHDILSVLMILMKEGKFKPFMESASYKKLYADEESSYQSFMIANKENQELIMSRALAFFASQKK